jgi:hypothetical protein
MSIPKLTQKAARAVYEYAGTEGLKKWDDLPPTVQISYVEEAEAAIKVVAEYLRDLADDLDPQCDEDYFVKGSMVALSYAIDPDIEPLDAR